MAESINLELKGNKEIEKMFKELPKQVDKNKTWVKFWRLTTKPFSKAAADNAPIADKDVPYPPDKSKMIKRGTLRDSMGFFTTKACKEVRGGYVGPKVKGKFKKNQGGYFGAWVEYGSEVMHYGKFTSHNQPFMQRAWDLENKNVIKNGFVDAEKIFKREMKLWEKKMSKHGALGY